MNSEVLECVIQRMANAKVEKEPYSYFHIDSVFPKEFYQELIDSFPDPSCYHPLGETGGVRKGTYTQRFCLFLENEHLSQLPFAHMIFWTQFSEMFKSPAFKNAILKKFESEYQERYGHQKLRLEPNLELISDHSNYAIGPHTDHPQKVLTLLFYFPRDDRNPHLGTSVYRPLDPHFRCEGLGHHSFQNFSRVYTAPFVPNSVFGFFKSDRSFHGVEPIGKQEVPRQLMSYNLLTYEG